MSNTDKLTEALIQFRNERDWEQFNNPKDLAIALRFETGELIENFIWKQPFFHEAIDMLKHKGNNK
jgi:NTP pyrophosphatase (non-canonical NTP hydrolase)